MEATLTPKRIHPLIATATIAVAMVSLVGIAAMTGLLPTSRAEAAPSAAAVTTMTDATHQSAVASTMNSAPSTSQALPLSAPPIVPTAVAQATICNNCGQVEAIRAILQTPRFSGVGAGALLGGILGHQIGHRNGNMLATVAAADVGGYVGNEVDKRSHTISSNVVDVRMQNGKLRSFQQPTGKWQVGDLVRVEDGHLTSRG